MRVPLPYPVLLAMVLACFSRGFISHRKKAFEWIALGVGLLTGFTGLLRPGELCGAQRGHLTLPSDAVFAFGHKAILAICNPKTKRFNGRMQFSIVDEPLVVSWLEWFSTSVDVDLKLFPFSTASLRVKFKELTQLFGIESCGFTPASLRAGGATRLFVNGCSVDRLRFIGRWKSLPTLEHYIQEATASIVLARLPPAAAALVHQLCLRFPQGPWPPAAPWPCFFSRAPQRVRTEAARLRSTRQRTQKSARVQPPAV